jgi:hypothetical protein
MTRDSAIATTGLLLLIRVPEEFWTFGQFPCPVLHGPGSRGKLEGDEDVRG